MQKTSFCYFLLAQATALSILEVDPNQYLIETIYTRGNSTQIILPKVNLIEETVIKAFAQNQTTSTLTTEIDTYLKAHDEIGGFSGAVIVVKAGETVFIQGYGMASLEYQIPNNSQTRFRLASVTKQFTAAAILQLQDRGVLDVQMPVSTYLSDYPNGERITVHHLLTHTAGIPDLTSFPDSEQWMKLPTTLDKLIARFQDLPLEFEPGEKFRYSNSGYILLTKIIETVSGDSYANYLQENLFKPLGMESTGYEYPLAIIEGLASGYQMTDNGYQKAEYINMLVPQGAGGLYSTVNDLARWNQFLFDHKSRDETILSNQAIAAMTSPIVSMGFEENPNLFYGYGLAIDKQPEHPRIAHNGGVNGFVSNLVYYPDAEMTIVILSNVQSVNSDRISKDLAAIIFGEPYELPTLPERATVAPKID
ncbi:MAG: serine hydrolase domain-containing protein [Limnoraphis sp.]